MPRLIPMNYQGAMITADDKLWFNATDMAKIFNKSPYEWLRLPETKRYIDKLCEISEQGKSRFVKTYKGGDRVKQGTWIHRKLVIQYARWLNIDFSIWCDEQIEKLLFETKEWESTRTHSKKSFQMMTDALKLTLEATGTEPQSHHFKNESCRINRALTGTWGKLDRDKLNERQLDILDSVLLYDTALIHQLKPPKERDAALFLFVKNRLGNQQLLIKGN